MKNKKFCTISWNGEIVVTNFFTFWKRFIRYFKGEPIFENTIYAPKKKYSKQELDKLREMLLLCEDSNESNTVIINAIRPNTFDKSILEVENSKYYAPTTEASVLLYRDVQ